MGPSFFILALVVVAGAVAAMSLRNLVHCALALTVTFAGLAAVYLQLQAQFVGLAQLLVYVGAVAILIVFAILLTRGRDTGEQPVVSNSWPVGLLVAFLVFGSLAYCVMAGLGESAERLEAPSPNVRAIGDKLMTEYVLPLEVIGLLLTAALIGAVLIAQAPERENRE